MENWILSKVAGLVLIFVEVRHPQAKKWPLNVIKVSDAILTLVTFSLLDRRGSDKPAKINVTTFWLLPVNIHKGPSR